LATLFVSVTLAGCAGFNPYPRRAPDERSFDAKMGTPPSSLDPSLYMDKSGAPLVVIRFPVAVEPGIKYEFVQWFAARQGLWKDQSGLWVLEGTAGGDDAVMQYALAEFTKTAYYAADLYKTLAARLPSGTVFLEPQTVCRDSDGILRTESAVQTRLPQAYVDFWVERRIINHSPQMGATSASSMGHKLIPHLSVGDVRVDESTGKWSLYPIVGWSIHNFHTASDGDNYVNALYRYPQNLAEMDNTWADVDKVLSDTASDSRPIQRGHFFKSDWLCYTTTSDDITNYAAAGDDAASPFQPIWDYYSNLIVESVNTDSAKGQTDGNLSEAVYASLFDDALASRIRSGHTAPNDQIKQNMIRQLCQFENQMICRQDANFVARIHGGEFAKSFRQTQVAESTYLTQFQSAVNEDTTQFVIALLCLSASVGAEASHPMPPAQVSQLNEQNQNLIETASLSEQTRDSNISALAASMHSCLNRTEGSQTAFLLRTQSGVQRIEAKGIADLRDKFRVVYRNNFH
jgi:GGDEF domain-containing protein